jgi:hypothetical protein
MRLAFASALLLAACGTADPAATDTPDAAPGAPDAAPGCVAITRTCAEVTAAFAAAGGDATITCDQAAGTFTMHATGLPQYMSNQSTPNMVDAQDWVVELPLTPTCAATPTDVVNSRGPIGFMVNGVAFFGPQNAQGQDAPTTEAATLDDCGGHADMLCTYHYHGTAACVFGQNDTLAAHVEDDGHPGLIGFGLDGFPLYGPYDAAIEPPLDACHGHVDATRGYHYHATASSPYFIGCFVGDKWDPAATSAGCN